MALGPGDEEGRDVVRADIVEVAGYAERFGSLLPADFVALNHLPTNTSATTLRTASRAASRRRLVKLCNMGSRASFVPVRPATPGAVEKDRLPDAAKS